MFRRWILAVITLAAIQGVLSQASTASVFPIVGPTDASLQGEILGTGTDGTTFVLSASPTDGSGPVTLTLIEDASHVSEFAAQGTGSVSAEFHVECGFDSASAGVCTLEELLANGANATTVLTTQTGTVTLTPVLVSTSGATPTATSPSSTQSQSTSAGATSSASTSGALKYAASGFGSILTLLLASMMST